MTAAISKKFIFILIASILLFSVVTASVSASGAFENILGFFAKLFTGKSINGRSITGQAVYERNSISCSEIENETRMEACLLRDALKNPDACSSLPVKKADNCYVTHAIKSRNETLCAGISDANVKSRCDDAFAFNKWNTSKVNIK
jgi:hypothetical protein